MMKMFFKSKIKHYDLSSYLYIKKKETKKKYAFYSRIRYAVRNIDIKNDHVNEISINDKSLLFTSNNM